MTNNENINSPAPSKTPDRPTSFKVFGIEFSGPAWLAVIFIVFCLILLFVAIDSNKKTNPELPMSPPATTPNWLTEKHSIDVPTRQPVNSVSLPLPSEPTANPFSAPEMIPIARGCFSMGSPSRDTKRENNEKQHMACVEDFSIGKTEVTKEQFSIFVTETNYKTESEINEASKSCYGWGGTNMQQDRKYNWRNPGFDQTNNEPVVCVSWNDTRAYIAWLNSKTKNNYRLPTEAEWEYAARGKKKDGEPTTTDYYWGNNDDEACQYANILDMDAKNSIANDWKPFTCFDGFIFTAPVGKFAKNTLGLYDMTGNVWEWTCSEYESLYSGKDVTCIKEIKEDSNLVLRGGSWRNYGNRVRSAYRYMYEPTRSNADHGFRLALTRDR